MSSLVYLLLALAGAVLFVVALASYLSPVFRRPSVEGELPWTPLQRRARWGLAVGLVWCGALAWLVLRSDPASMVESRGERLLFTVVLLVGVAVYLAVVGGVGRPRTGRFLIDERDREILTQASALQSGATILTLLAWSIGLTEAYWSDGAVPIAFPFLIFWSTFVVYLVSYSAGILLGYRRSVVDGEG